MDYSLLLVFYRKKRHDSEMNNVRGYTFHLKKGENNNNSYEIEEYGGEEQANHLITPLVNHERRRSN